MNAWRAAPSLPVSLITVLLKRFLATQKLRFRLYQNRELIGKAFLGVGHWRLDDSVVILLE